MEEKDMFFCLLLLFAGCIPVLEDPYHQQGKVGLWTWLFREADELVHGERG